MKTMKTDVSVDTVSLCWYDFDTDFDLSNWKYSAAKATGRYDSFLYYKNGVTLVYMPAMHLIIASFSASKVANGVNCIPYRCEQYQMIRDRVEEVLSAATDQPLRLKDSVVSRLDVYKSFTFHTIDEAREMVAWMQNQPRLGKSRKKIYGDNGDYRWFKNGLALKTYLKNDDPRLSDATKKELKPTVRIEAECRKGARREFIGKQVSGEYALRYPAVWVGVFNDTLNRFKLGGTMMSSKTVKEILRGEYPKAKPSTIDKYLKILGSLPNKSTRRKQVELIGRVYKHGICPFFSTATYYLPAKEVPSTDIQRLMELFRECIDAKRERKTICLDSRYPIHQHITKHQGLILPEICDSS